MLSKSTIKFGVLVGFAAIFIDAAIAHGLFWENDPYWTYWITKTFLITTVFTLGTAFLRTGLWQGAVLTAVHTLILEVYYQWFASIGLPQEPQWLSFRDLWEVGFITHYLAIFIGYLVALWIYRRTLLETPVEGRDSRAVAITALLAAVLVLVLQGILTQGILLNEFPGVTFYIQYLLIAFVFLMAWFTYVGFDFAAWTTGAGMLSLTWITYSMYLGPIGLPNNDPTYLNYEELWLKSFPGGFVAGLIGIGLVLWLRPYWERYFISSPIPLRIRPLHLLLVAGLAALAFVFALVSGEDQPGLPASASATGPAEIVTGPDPVDMASTAPADGTISIEVTDEGNRWSHVQNIDTMNVVADITAGNDTYRVVIDQAMPRHPLGAYTTWFGVVYNANMHGDTGIGSSQLPEVMPDIAVWGWADVWLNDTQIAAMAPAHVMVTSEDSPIHGVMLEVATEDKSLLDAPDGYLNVLWPTIDSMELPEDQQRNREYLGWVVMLGLAVLFGVLAWRDPWVPTVV